MPLGGAGEFKRLYKAVAAVKGTPSRIMFPIGTHHVKRLLELVGLTECQERDVLVCVLGTVLCMRVVELSFLQVCDMLWDHDAAFHAMYLGTLAVHIYRRKQDTARKGMYCRVGLASNAEWDLARRLRRHAERYALRVSPRCTKAENPGARCRNCLPFFFTGAGEQREMLSRQQVTRGVIKSLELIGVDTEHFSQVQWPINASRRYLGGALSQSSGACYVSAVRARQGDGRSQLYGSGGPQRVV